VAPQRVEVNGQTVAAAISPLLNEDGTAALTRLTAGGTDIDIGEFTPLGVFLTYQPEQARLSVRLAADILAERVIGPGAERELVNVQEPVPLSGFINLRGRSVAATEGDPEWIQAEVEPVINYRGWVWESQVGLTSGDTDQVELRHTRLVRDFGSPQLRGEVGIVRYDYGALFGAPEVIGVSATRKEEIGYGPALYREGTTEFVVPAAGAVDLYLNGRLYQNYRLTPGPHRTAGLPLGQGTNRLRVEAPAARAPTAEDDATAPDERTVIVDRYIYYSPRLAAAGRHVYSAAAGVVREQDVPDGMFTSGLYNYGVSRHITVGGSTQLAPQEYALGAHSLVASRFGVSRVDLAGYADDTGAPGSAVEVAHAVSLLYLPRVPKVEVQGRYQSAEYHRVHGPRSIGASFRAAAIVNQRIGTGANASATLIRTWPLSGNAVEETAIRVGAQYRSRDGYSLNVQLGPTIYGDGEVVWQGSIFVRISTDDRGINTSANYDLGGGPATLQVANAPRKPYRSVNWSATAHGFDQSPGSVEYAEGTVGYRGYRGSAQIQPRVQRTIGAENTVTGVTGRYASAVVWAGGAPMISRPVQNGFVVFVPREHIAPYPVAARPGGGAVGAIVRNRGAVLPDIPSWGTTSVTLDGSQLPDGFFPGTTPVSFRSAYRTGYRVTVGSLATVYVTGRLVDDRNKPIGLEAGEVVDAQGNSNVFFSDRDGAFEIIDIAPGEYRLYLYSYPEAQSIFAVPEGESGRYEVGDVVFLTEES
jgi:outer membrane usher protein